MSIVAVTKSKITSIANKIREKLDITDAMRLEDMSSKVDEVYKAGKQAQHDEFWTDYMNASAVGLGERLFGNRGWTDKTFKPPENKVYNFERNVEHFFAECEIKNLKGILEERNTIFDFKKCIRMVYFAHMSKITHFPKIDMSNCIESSHAFGDCPKMVELTLVSSKNTVFGANMFLHCESLTDLTIEGTIGNNFDVHWSENLSYESLQSILDALYDYSKVSTTKTLNLGSTNLEKLTQAEKAAANRRGWTLL